jgi:hypothetical protein
MVRCACVPITITAVIALAVDGAPLETALKIVIANIVIAQVAIVIHRSVQEVLIRATMAPVALISARMSLTFKL